MVKGVKILITRLVLLGGEVFEYIIVRLFFGNKVNLVLNTIRK